MPYPRNSRSSVCVSTVLQPNEIIPPSAPFHVCGEALTRTDSKASCCLAHIGGDMAWLAFKVARRYITNCFAILRSAQVSFSPFQVSACKSPLSGCVSKGVRHRQSASRLKDLIASTRLSDCTSSCAFDEQQVRITVISPREK